MSILKVENLVKHFPVRGGVFNHVVGAVQAVNGVSFEVNEGEIVGVVGESGCGKSTLGKAILQLFPLTSGKVFFEDTEISELNRKQMLPFRRQMQMIFQDPNSSLNPRMTISGAIKEIAKLHKSAPRKELNDYVDQLLKKSRNAPLKTKQSTRMSFQVDKSSELESPVLWRSTQNSLLLMNRSLHSMFLFKPRF